MGKNPHFLDDILQNSTVWATYSQQSVRFEFFEVQGILESESSSLALPRDRRSPKLNPCEGLSQPFTKFLRNLLEKDQFLDARECPGLHSIKIDSTGETACFEPDRFVSSLLNLIHQRCHLLPEDVVDNQ